MARIERLFSGRVSERPQHQINSLESRIRALEASYGIGTYRTVYGENAAVVSAPIGVPIDIPIEVPDSAQMMLVYFEAEINGTRAFYLQVRDSGGTVLSQHFLNSYIDAGGGFPGTHIVSGRDSREQPNGSWLGIPAPSGGSRSLALVSVGATGTQSRNHFLSADVL